MFEIMISLLLVRPYGCPWGSIELEEPIDFDSLGLKYDHQVLKQLEPKHLSKTGIFNYF